MRFESRLTEGRFVRRDNRFVIHARIGRRTVAAALPSTGRLRELLIPGARVWLRHSPAPHRKTDYTCELVEYRNGTEQTLVSVNTHRCNGLVREALDAGRLEPLTDWHVERGEVTWGDSRFDLSGTGPGGPWLLEVKSVTLVQNGVALFPDAPTARGRKHMLGLAAAVTAGYQTAAVFCIVRDDAKIFRPHSMRDPSFADAVRTAAKSGVQIIACTCRVTQHELTVHRIVPVDWAF